MKRDSYPHPSPPPGALPCVLGQENLLSRCLSSPQVCKRVPYDELASHPEGTRLDPNNIDGEINYEIISSDYSLTFNIRDIRSRITKDVPACIGAKITKSSLCMTDR